MALATRVGRRSPCHQGYGKESYKVGLLNQKRVFKKKRKSGRSLKFNARQGLQVGATIPSVQEIAHVGFPSFNLEEFSPEGSW
jgi:hypothetical protein